MKNYYFVAIILFCFLPFWAIGQSKDPMIQKIMDEVFENSEAEMKKNGHELLDDIGPRLVGTPQMKQAHDWAVAKYDSYQISAENQQWGQWKAWERGITHVDMVSPRIQTLAATQLAWSPGTSKKGITAEVIVLPAHIKDSLAFQKWLPQVKGKFVMIAMEEPTGRPDHDWDEWATPESFEKMKKERNAQRRAWNENINRSGLQGGAWGRYSKKNLILAIENAGAVGILDNYWSNGFGTDKIFGTYSQKVPTINVHLEDYTMLYRMVQHGDRPEIHVVARSKDLGTAPTFNTVAQIKGSEKPDEYVMLSAHFDSWDGGTGATDNGSGTLLMMEVMRVLKKLYPNPKRTIMVGHWGSEEQGLNGSAAFVADHPEIISNIQVLFNQDNGTGRVKTINGSGFLHAYEYLGRWLAAVPDTVSKIETTFPGSPAMGGTDHASFVRAGVPAFNLSSLSWSYWNYTWHTNRDTYDKLVWDDLTNNVLLTAVLAYMASEDPETASREQMVLPVNRRTGEPGTWPSPREPERNGGN